MSDDQKTLNELHKKDTWFYLREKGSEMFKFLASLIPKSCKFVLDVACGEAFILNHLPENICYHGFDLSNYIIEKNFKTYEERFASGHAWFTVDDMLDPKEEGHFDCVLFFGALTTLNRMRILNLISFYKNKYNPKYVLIEDLAQTDLSLVEKHFTVLQKVTKCYNFIKEPVQVGTPEQINNRQILLLKVG